MSKEIFISFQKNKSSKSSEGNLDPQLYYLSSLQKIAHQFQTLIRSQFTSSSSQMQNELFEVELIWSLCCILFLDSENPIQKLQKWFSKYYFDTFEFDDPKK